MSADAKSMQSDLYLITQANSPFEVDLVYYGGDHRESPDEFWIGIAEKYGLKYKVLEPTDLTERVSFGVALTRMAARPRTQMLEYDRHGF